MKVTEESDLTDVQRGRIEALRTARDLVRTDAKIENLLDVAAFILEGPVGGEHQELHTLSGQVVGDSSSWAAGIAPPVDPAPGERSPF